MKLTGIELQNFRSIGSEPVVLAPLKKCNILIGQNNAGKSNVLRAVKLLSDKYRQNTKLALQDIDAHNRRSDVPFKIKLYFEADLSIDYEKQLAEVVETNKFWFELEWGQTGEINVANYSLTEITNFHQFNRVFNFAFNLNWSNIVNPERMAKEFRDKGNHFFSTRFSPVIPEAYFIPEFRKIQAGANYTHDGTQLVELLAEYHMPVIGKDKDQEKFYTVQNFMRRLLHLPDADLEISRSFPTLIINNKGLRLPLASYGTGAHELIILITAVLSMNNAICCIEEPEIHLHPKLQREFIEFITTETTNQYLISSHSAAFINMAESQIDIQLIPVSRESGYTAGRPVATNSDKLAALHELGIRASDLLQANCVIWAEGPSDRVYLQQWLKLLSPDLVEGRDYIFMYYRQLPRLSIDTNDDVEELINVLRLNQHAIIVMDGDRPNAGEAIDSLKTSLKQKCEDSGGIGWITERREIENYLSARTVSEACRDLRKVSIEVSLTAHDEFESAINKALKSAEAQQIGYSKDKLNYSRKFAEYITVDDIDPELKERIEQIISKIRHWCQ